VRLIVGLGNPGRRYAGSRHNVGYWVVDELARRWSIDVSRHQERFEGYLGEGQREGERIVLLKPTTYMNLSGRSVAAVWRFYKLELADVLVTFDDLDLPVGHVRVRAMGSAGGHRGFTDVLRHLGSAEVARVRVGIGKVHRSATVEYVLGPFEADERPRMEQALWTAADACECWLRRGIEAAMNEFNRKSADTDRPSEQSPGPGPEGESS